MKKTLTLIITIACMCVSTYTYSQNDISLTARYGINTIGLTAAVPVSSVGSIEGMYTISHDKSRCLFTGLYEERYMIAHKPHIQWFAGVGLHAGYRKLEKMVNVNDPKDDRLIYPGLMPFKNKQFIAGADAIIGISYKIPHIPVMITLDAKPNTDFINQGSMMVDGGIRLGLSF